MILCCNKMANRFPKRPGTSGIRGPLYETKLLSLIYFRAIHDDDIEEFYLASNVDKLGSFDDICFKAKFKDNNKPLVVFLQAKHRENNDSVLKLKESDLAEYFNSYLEVRRKFNPNNKDVLFNSTLGETECVFVIYTNAKGDKKFSTHEGSFFKNWNDLISTGVPGSQTSHNERNVELLCEILLKEQMKALAQQMAKCICDKSGSEMSMNELMTCYHVILALNVLDVSDEIQHEEHRIASFKPDFFATNDKYLVLFKNKLCLEVIKNLKSKETDIQSLLLKFLREPSDVPTLSKLLVASVLNYKNDKLEFVSKFITDGLKRQLDIANVPQSTVYEAAELAAKEYLLSLKIKVPALFGNKDLAIRGNDIKVQKRLNHLTNKFEKILTQSDHNHIVTIDESLEKGFLQLNGGIASAVGNILVLDETSKLLKFTDTCESLGKLAKRWYETLKSKIPNLHEYKLDVKAKVFPKLSFATDEYNKIIVIGFLNTLLFFTSQCNEKEVENILIKEITKTQGDDVQHVKVASDAIYLKYHDVIQRWSMESDAGMGTYLEKEGFIYKDALKHEQMMQKNTNVIKFIDMSTESQMQILENNKVIFQGNEVNLRHFLNNSTIGYVGGDVLYKIMHGNKNTIGKPVSNFNHKPELYIQRRVRPFCRDTGIQESVDRNQNQTLGNLEDDVVVIFGDPGMGKSSLLTHFSLKMKEGEWGNTRWIVRVNLLEHTTQFRKWKDKKMKIGTTESLEFLCQVALSEESSKAMDMNISLVQCDDGTVHVDFKGDAWTLFELKMFLNFYNNAQIIILLDGFDEICPTYEYEVLALIEAVRKFSKTHKIWITSRSYDKMVSIFENFKLFELGPFTVDEQNSYLSKFWEEKNILGHLDDNQIKNICDCIWYVSRSTRIHYAIASMFFGLFYKVVLKSFAANMSYVLVGLSLIKYINKNRSTTPATIMKVIDETFEYWYIEPIENECLATPLDLNIMADYLYSQIKEINIEQKDEWDWDYTIIDIYKYYLERKLRIRFQEKTHNDMSKPDNISTYEREYSSSVFGTGWFLQMFFIFACFRLKLEKHTHLFILYSYFILFIYLYAIAYNVFVNYWTVEYAYLFIFIFVLYVLIYLLILYLMSTKYNNRVDYDKLFTILIICIIIIGVLSFTEVIEINLAAIFSMFFNFFPYLWLCSKFAKF